MSRARRVGPLVLASALLAVSAPACGARTPLGAPARDGAAPPAPSIDAAGPRDAGPDAHDAAPDARDAAPDARDAAPDARDAEPPDARVPCVPGRFELSRPVARMMLVLDASGSMDFALDGSLATLANPSRWTLLRDALAVALPPFDATEIGLKLYPEPVDPRISDPAPRLTCQVENGVNLAPAAAQAARAIAAVEARDPSGGTPTAEAMRIAADWLSERSARNVANFIVLATDGGPNCNPDLDRSTCVCSSLPVDGCRDDASRGVWRCVDGERTLEVIHDAADTHGIPVYVIGIDDPLRPDLVDLTNQMAVAGRRPREVPGEPRFYRIRRPEDLTEAFSAIAGSVAQCTFVSPSAPDDPEAITIFLDGEPLPRSGADGWDWVDPVFGTIGLFGSACARAAAGEVALSAVVMCREP